MNSKARTTGQIRSYESGDRIEELFEKALRCPPEERERFLLKACQSNISLYSEIASLLAHQGKLGNTLEMPFLSRTGALQLLARSPALQPGERVGSYQVLELLGIGGMGEVYLALDLELGRKVAIKLLPRAVANDSIFLDRLEREARVASRLNHPNILTVHQFLREQDRCYLITEWIEGQSLREHIRETPLTLKEALPIARQIATALSAAHTHGILHRDIKPENLMLRPEGLLKVLDFGLAKAVPLSGLDLSGVEEPISDGGSVPGALVGTVAYMAPEQIRGETLDARTDIWSWGIVLYEMLTRVRPFEGSTAADTLARILDDELDLGNLPKPVRPVVARALQKRREDRYHSASELITVLDTLETQLRTRFPSEAPWRVRIGKQFAWFIPLLLLAGLVAAFQVYVAWRDGPFEVERAERLTSLGNVSETAISPDGHYIAYASGDTNTQGLRLRQIDTRGDTQLLMPASGAISGITMAPGSDYVYFIRQDQELGRLYRLPVIGGTPQLVVEDVDSPVSFSPDGDRICFLRNDALHARYSIVIRRLKDATEENLVVRHPPYYLSFTGPTWSPDGRWVLFAEYCPDGRGGMQNRLKRIDVGSPGGKREEKYVGPSNWSIMDRPVWLNHGTSLMISALHPGSTEFAIYFLGIESNRLSSVRVDAGSYGNLSLTNDGMLLATVQTDRVSDVWIVPAENPAAAHRINAEGARFRGIAWSGNDHLLSQSSLYGRPDLWEMNLDGKPLQPITRDEFFEWDVAATRNGRFVVYISDHDGTPHLWKLDRSEPDPDKRVPSRLTASSQREEDTALTPDDRWAIYTSTSSDGNISTIWRVPLAGGKPEQLTRGIARRPAVSPDGRWIACEYSPDSATWWLALLPPSGAGSPHLLRPISTDYGVRWSPDNRTLTYIETSDGVSNLWAQSIDGSEPRQITSFREDTIFAFDWAPNGKYVACVRGSVTSDLVLFHRKPRVRLWSIFSR